MPSTAAGPGRPAAQHRGDAGGQFRQLHGFRQIVVGADLEADHPVDQVAGAGQHDDPGIEPGTQRARELEAVRTRKPDVENEEVRHRATRQQRVELAAVPGGDHLVAVQAEEVRQHLADVPLVVDDGDQRHGTPCAAAACGRLRQLKQIRPLLTTG